MIEPNLEFHKNMRIKLSADLRNQGIDDEIVLDSIKSVPRHVFFGQETALADTFAYENKSFPIGEGQTISRPCTAALQASSLKIKPNDRVLEIGTGSGYLAALLGEMGAKIYTVERFESFFEKARILLDFLGYKNIWCYWHDGNFGLMEESPFDKIILTAYVTELPKELLNQLKIGGIIVFPYGDEQGCTLIRVTKMGEEKFESEELASDMLFSPIRSGIVPKPK